MEIESRHSSCTQAEAKKVPQAKPGSGLSGKQKTCRHYLILRLFITGSGEKA